MADGGEHGVDVVAVASSEIITAIRCSALMCSITATTQRTVRSRLGSGW